MELAFKILVVGDVNTGKTSLLREYVHGSASETYKPTLGFDFHMKSLEVDGNFIRIELWDIQGQERIKSMTRSYYQNASAALIVFDVSRPETLKSVCAWKKDIEAKTCLEDKTPTPCFLLGNKCDLPRHPDVPDEAGMDAFCADNMFKFWRWTSTRTGEGLACFMQDILNVLFETHHIGEPVKLPATPQSARHRSISLSPSSSASSPFSRFPSASPPPFPLTVRA